MLEIKTLASGSLGNCYRISNESGSFLIECGLTVRRIKEGLNFRLSEIDFCLISHSHQDHCKSFKDISRAGIPVYTGAETIKTIDPMSEYRLHEITPLKQFQVGSFMIMGFPLIHDVLILGFLIASGEDKLCFITDTSYCPYRFKGVSHFMIEANYQSEILEQNIESGLCDYGLKKRLLETHLSLDNVIEFLKANDLSRMREIFLIHLSSRNANAKQMKEAVEAEFGKPVFICGASDHVLKFGNGRVTIN